MGYQDKIKNILKFRELNIKAFFILLGIKRIKNS